MINAKNVAIGIKVRTHRKARGLSMEQLCDLLTDKITPQQMALYETGKSRWPADLICDIARILPADVRKLLDIPL